MFQDKNSSLFKTGLAAAAVGGTLSLSHEVFNTTRTFFAERSGVQRESDLPPLPELEAKFSDRYESLFGQQTLQIRDGDLLVSNEDLRKILHQVYVVNGALEHVQQADEGVRGVVPRFFSNRDEIERGIRKEVQLKTSKEFLEELEKLVSLTENFEEPGGWIGRTDMQAAVDGVEEVAKDLAKKFSEFKNFDLSRSYRNYFNGVPRTEDLLELRTACKKFISELRARQEAEIKEAKEAEAAKEAELAEAASKVKVTEVESPAGDSKSTSSQSEVEREAAVPSKEEVQPEGESQRTWTEWMWSPFKRDE